MKYLYRNLKIYFSLTTTTTKYIPVCAYNSIYKLYNRITFILSAPPQNWDEEMINLSSKWHKCFKKVYIYSAETKRVNCFVMQNLLKNGLL